MIRTSAVLTMALACVMNSQASSAAERLVFFGTHGMTSADVRPGQTIPSHGIYAARFDDVTGKLTPLGLSIELERPTWLINDPAKNIIYAVNELGNDGKTNGQVLALRPQGTLGKLSIVSQIDAKGGGTTHLAYDIRSATLFAANYGGGQAVSFPVNADGSIGEAASVVADYGNGPTPRQDKPHAHGVTVDPSGHFLLVPDLGADRIFIYRIEAAQHGLKPSNPPFEALPAGTGPRHISFSPNGKFAYLLSELTAEIRTYAWDAGLGRLNLIEVQSTLAPGWYGAKSAGDIQIFSNGRFVYVSNRGEDSLVVYAVDEVSGKLHEIQRLAAQGDQPWHLSFDPAERWLLVADEASSLVAVYQVDGATGRLTPTPNVLHIPKPVNIAFGNAITE